MNKYLVNFRVGLEVYAADENEAESIALEIMKTDLDACFVQPSPTKPFLVEMEDD